MFAAFTDKLKRVLEIKSMSEIVASDNNTVNVPAATTTAVTNISDGTNNKGVYSILESLGFHFGSIAYCTKDIQGMDATSEIKPEVNTVVEDTKDVAHGSKATTNIPSDDDLISSGPKNMMWRSVYIS